MKERLLSMLALLLMAVTGAWAQTEKLLTTVTATGYQAYSQNPEGVVTLAISRSNSYDSGAGWQFYGGGVSVTPKTGYEITRCVFRQGSQSVTVSSTPFELMTTYDMYNERVYFPQNENMSGVKSIDVYGYDNTVAVSGITLSETNALITLGGDALTLTATVAPDNATDKTVTWTTSDASVASVANGVVTAVGVGTATITATATNGTADTSDDKTATCEVTVAVPATYTATMKEGTEDAANWSITPTEGLNENDQVTIKYSGSNMVKSIKVKKVASAVPVSSITLNKTETSIMVGSTETLSVTAVAPDNATDKTYTWNTKDASKATVDQDGKVTAVAEGTVTIYAEANDGSGVTATCDVTVTPKLYSITLKGEISGTSLVVEFYAGQTWNDMITKYSSTLKVARGRYVGFPSDADGMVNNNGMLVRTTDQLDPNGVYSLR